LPPAALLGLRPILQGATVDKLRNQVLPTLELTRIVHREDVRMIQRRCHLRLPLKAAPRDRVDQIGGEKFDCHRTVELGIERPVDGAHSAFAKL
jgi:hypothetical protein